VLDNFPAAVAGADPLNPRPTRAFVEYSQARGFLLDPARVRRPEDKACASNCTSSIGWNVESWLQELPFLKLRSREVNPQSLSGSVWVG